MNGLRIRSLKPWHLGDHGWKLGYCFDDLLRAIEPLRDDLYWVLDADYLNSTSSGEAVFDDAAEQELLELVFIRDEVSAWNLVAQPSFLRRFSPFVPNDWVDIAGTLVCPPRSGVPALSSEWVETMAEIYFSCIDGAYWEVYARDDEVLNRAARSFPQAQPCQLCDKRA